MICLGLIGVCGQYVNLYFESNLKLSEIAFPRKAKNNELEDKLEQTFF